MNFHLPVCRGSVDVKAGEDSENKLFHQKSHKNIVLANDNPETQQVGIEE